MKSPESFLDNVVVGQRVPGGAESPADGVPAIEQSMITPSQI